MNIEEESLPESTPAVLPAANWKVQHVYLLAIVCLLLGVLLGYLVRGSQSAAPSATASAKTPATSDTPRQPRSLEEMKSMADKAAAPLLDKLKTDPNSFEALNEAGKVYRATHQFKEAAGYYERALQVNPKSAATRTDLASCLYYTGDVDGALAQLDKALSYDPQFFGALLNLGIIRIQAKNDSAGAIRSWEKILKTDSDPQHKEVAKKLIASARQQAVKQASDNVNGDSQ